VKLTESVYLLSDLMAMGVADLEGIAAAGDKEQYPVRPLLNFFPACVV
jgi:hypothetical protein